MPSQLEIAMESLIKVFHNYASREGRSGTLSRRELRELMENELSNFLRVRKNGPKVRILNVQPVIEYIYIYLPLFLCTSLRRTLQL